MGNDADLKYDPEQTAGQRIRQLRTERGWSQEETARRMRSYGYDYHQTTVAKIEAGQRPFRVRELVDFAALFGMPPEHLIQQPAAGELEQEIRQVRQDRDEAAVREQHAREAVAACEATLASAQEQYARTQRICVLLDSRLEYLTSLARTDR